MSREYWPTCNDLQAEEFGIFRLIWYYEINLRNAGFLNAA